MITNLGYGALVLSFIVSLYGVFAAVYGETKKEARWVQSAKNAMLLVFPLLTVAAGSIIYLLVNDHFEVAYVASVTSRSMPTYLRVTALWGGQAGSLVFWSWTLSLFASLVTLRDWSRDREFLSWVIVVCLGTLAFFLLLSVFVENPYERLWATPTSTQPISAMFQPAGSQLYTPSDGRGLNPLLRHPGMVIHPPMLYLGFVSLVIPYAFAIAALVTGRTDDRWIKLARRWMLWAWLFLSMGLILGGRWAYDVLGWGGYWGWDPVEVASLLPWLVATPLLHSVMIQEKRNMFKAWNMVLVILTYDAMLLGTFLTRSGVFSSVHAFAQSAIGPLFFSFIAFTLVISLWLVTLRWDELQGENKLSAWLSREGLFLLNNFVFLAIFAICLWGVLFPLISEAIIGQKLTVGPPWYERTTGPFWAAALLLMGVAPLSAWSASTAKTLGRALWKPTLLSVPAAIIPMFYGITNPWALITTWLVTFVTFVTLYDVARTAFKRSRSRGENILISLWKIVARNRRRYGGYTIHLGVVMMAVGIMGIEMFQTETQGALSLGEEMSLGAYTLRYDSLTDWKDQEENTQITRAVMSVFKGGEKISEIYPRQDYYYESQDSMTIPGVRSTMEDDLYVLLVAWQPISTQRATFKIYHNPLVNWLWLGSIVFILGTLVAAWPEREKSIAEQKSAYRKAAVKTKS